MERCFIVYTDRNISNSEEISSVFSHVSIFFGRGSGIVNAVTMDEY